VTSDHQVPARELTHRSAQGADRNGIELGAPRRVRGGGCVVRLGGRGRAARRLRFRRGAMRWSASGALPTRLTPWRARPIFGPTSARQRRGARASRANACVDRASTFAPRLSVRRTGV